MRQAESRGAGTSRRPLQKRSRLTQSKLLDATERLLAERPFEEITIADIVREASSSVGAFYSRFADKSAVLAALYERHDERLTAEGRDGGPEDEPLEALALRTCREVVDYYRRQRWFLRAICLHARTDPGAIDDDVRARRLAFHRRVAEPLARHADPLAHEDPLRAAEWALFLVASVARDKILFGEAPHSASISMSDEDLAREMARTLAAYLRSAPAIAPK